MSTSLQELLKIAGLLSDPKATRPRRIGDATLPQPADAPPGGMTLSPPPDAPAGGAALAIPPIPVGAQAPPRPMPEIVPTGAPPNLSTDEFANFGSSGEPFGSTRQRRTQPRDYLADDLQYARDIERQPRNKVLDILTGITQGIASLEGNQPKQPWNFSGRERKLNDVYGRIGKELGAQKEQAQIKNVGALGDYRQQTQVGAQQKRMIDLYKSLPRYTKGANAAIDQMFASAGLEFEDKDPKSAKPGARHYFKMNGQEMILDPGASEAYAATGPGSSELVDRSQVPVETRDPRTGEMLTVKPGTALTASATALSQGATQGRFDVEEFHRRQNEARTASDNWQKAWDEAQSMKAAVDALEAKRVQQGGNLYGDDAVHMATWPKMADSANMRATSLMNEINTRHGDFYYIDQNGLTAKNPSPPSVQAGPQTSAPSKQGRTLAGAIEAFRKSQKREPTADEIVKMNAALNQ